MKLLYTYSLEFKNKTIQYFIIYTATYKTMNISYYTFLFFNQYYYNKQLVCCFFWVFLPEQFCNNICFYKILRMSNLLKAFKHFNCHTDACISNYITCARFKNKIVHVKNYRIPIDCKY